MKKLTLIPILLLSCLSLFAGQFRLGVEGGLTYTIIHTATRFENTTFSNNINAEVAIPVEYSFTNWLSINSGIRYILKATSYNKSYIDDGKLFSVDSITEVRHFLELPLSIRISFGNERMRGFIGAGGYVGIWLFEFNRGRSATLLGSMNWFYQNIPIDSNSNRFDGGILAEVGFSYSLKLGRVYAICRYQYGLTSLAKSGRNVVHTYLDNLSLTAGFMFNIGGGSK